MSAGTEQVRSSSDQLAHYLLQLTPQARCRLLAELERLRLVGDDIPHHEELIRTLRAEFRKTGESHHRVGNPSRYFFEPLEPVLFDVAPERASAGQIARGSLAPIWSLVIEKLLPSMAEKYVSDAKSAILADRLHDARQIAAGFQGKVVTYLQRTLEADEGKASVRAGLMAYTSSHATFDDLNKMIEVLRLQKELAEFGRLLPPKIAKLDRSALGRIAARLNTLRSKHANAVPFGLTIISRRLERPYELLQVAVSLVGSRSMARIAATPYAVAIPMVLDQIEEKRRTVLSALKSKHVLAAREAVVEIFKIEAALREQIDLRGSEWDERLGRLMADIQSTIQSEIETIPTDHDHLTHIFESLSLRPHRSAGNNVVRMLEKGRDAVLGFLSS